MKGDALGTDPLGSPRHGECRGSRPCPMYDDDDEITWPAFPAHPPPPSTPRPRPPRWRRADEEQAELEGLTDDAPLRALVAEDDADMRQLLARWLESAGFDVIQAEDGDELIAWLRCFERGSPDAIALDLVVSDLRMPGPSGLSVLEQLRLDDGVTPVILISAFADACLVDEAARLGAAVLAKPFGKPRLLSALAELGLG